ncbi:MAG TPA: carboxypeptidase-like regulatory domain-containing protein [Candidatus Baltobacteraceae bacterium]|nr:carboxypeptidase-like regulatory domain-containing protein [Candidatus Baltobacteraceae bacterium]
MLTVGLFASGATATHASDLPVADERLIVGTVRDQAGAVVPADVSMLDAAGHTLRSVSTAGDGTFALSGAAGATQIEVRCRHCQTVRRAIAGDAPIIVIVRRYLALDQTGPTSADLLALPYSALISAASLAPLQVAAAPFISDRGLGLGRGLVFESGAPAYNLVDGGSDIADTPARIARSLRYLAAGRGFEYGATGDAGVIAVSSSGQSGLEVDDDRFSGHWNTSLLSPSVAESNGGTLLQRAVLDGRGDFTGGTVQGSLGVGASDDGVDRAISLGTISLSAQLPGMRLSQAFGASRFADGYGGPSALSSDVVESLRLEGTGPVALGVGATLRQGNSQTGPATQRLSDNVGFVDVRAGGDRGNIFAGVSAESVDLERSPFPALQTSAVLGAVEGQTQIVGGLRLSVGLSSSLYLPTYDDAVFGQASIGRETLAQGKLAFDDDRRLRVELSAFREDLSGAGTQTLRGIGLGAAWQIAPLVSLRAWTLRDNVNVYGYFLFPAQPSLTRSVAWLSYENPGGIRLDAIWRRDVSPSFTSHVDGDVVVPILRPLSMTIGSGVENSKRRTYIGVVFQ